MAKKEVALTDKDFDQELEILKRKDLSFASRLHSLQDKHFPRRLKNISEWSEAEKVKRLILGMNSEKIEHSGTLNVNFSERLELAKKRAAEAIKSGASSNKRA